MTTTHTPTPLYVGRTGVSHQRLLIEESTGRTVAVVYDAEDAGFLVHAANHHEALRRTLTKTTGALAEAAEMYPARSAQRRTVEEQVEEARRILSESATQ